MCAFYTTLQNDWGVQKDFAKWALFRVQIPIGYPSLRSLGGPSAPFDDNFCSFQIVLLLFSSFKQLPGAAVFSIWVLITSVLDFCYFLPLWRFPSALLFSVASAFISAAFSATVLSIHLRESGHSGLWRWGHSLPSGPWLPQWVVPDWGFSSGNSGDPSSGCYFGAVIRISTPQFRFYQPLLCLPA